MRHRPSHMPPANAAAIATAGSFMTLFATSPAFRYGKSAETSQTDALRQSHTYVLQILRTPACVPRLSELPDRAPTWQGRTIDRQCPEPPGWQAGQRCPHQGPRAEDQERRNPAFLAPSSGTPRYV